MSTPPPLDTVLQGDCRALLRSLPAKSVHCVVSSPPYWNLRVYATNPQVWGGDPVCDHQWHSKRYYREGGNSVESGLAFSAPGPANAERIKATRWHVNTRCLRCGAWRGELGGEPTPDEYVAHIVEVFRAVRRVLRDDGTLWLNLGDSYAGSNKGFGALERNAKRPHANEYLPGPTPAIAGLPAKNLVGIPWRVALALQADGWILRSDIIWHKPNSMPESVRDRPTKSHEYVFLLTKQARYFYDEEAVREAATPQSPARTQRTAFLHQRGQPDDDTPTEDTPDETDLAGRNLRSVWSVSTEPYAGAHFAVMPTALVEPCVLAGCPVNVCEHCGAPWEREIVVASRPSQPTSVSGKLVDANSDPYLNRAAFDKDYRERTVGDYRPTCTCAGARGSAQGIVLDPFMGSGTIGVVARRHSRHYLGLELNPDYIELAEKRIGNEIQPSLWSAPSLPAPAAGQ